MKKLYLFLILCACCLTSSAWAQNRNIYIWDVTRSMIGKGMVNGQATPDVYDKVEDYLIKDINRIANNHTEIVVIPFQEGVLFDQIISVPNSTDDSKKQIIEKIKQTGPLCMKLKHSNTNISEPLLYAQRTYQKADKVNTLVLLTDGRQNMNGGMDALREAIIGWSNNADEDEFLIYVLTTENAEQPTSEDLDNVDYVTEGEFVNQLVRLQLKPTSEIAFNIKDQKSINVSFANNSDVPLPTGAKIRVQSQAGAPIAINEVVELVNGAICITPDFDYEALKTQLAEEVSMRLVYSVENNDELKAKQNKKVAIVPAHSQVKLINKKERVLTISVVEE